jgi:maltooligosyltrehalose trehalohydrolase
VSFQPRQCVVASQNHDQIGNRLLGERLSTLVGFEQLKLAAGVLCLAPFLPLLFMGEEYGETAPFQYFVDHSDPELLAAVRAGRAGEFASFGWKEPPPDPAAPATLDGCRPNRELAGSGPHQVLRRLYCALLRLRPLFAETIPDECIAFEAQRALLVRRGQQSWIIYAFSAKVEYLTVPAPAGVWEVALASAATEWAGPGSGTESWLESNGELTLELPAHSFLFCTRRE